MSSQSTVVPFKRNSEAEEKRELPARHRPCKKRVPPPWSKKANISKVKYLQGKSAARAASVYLHCTSSAFSEKETENGMLRCVHIFSLTIEKGYKKNWLYSCTEIQ